MRLKTMTVKWIAAFGIMIMAAQASAEETSALKTKADKESYAIGVDIARNIKRQKIELEGEALLKGMRDGFTGANFLMSEEDLSAALTTFQTEFKQKRALAVKSIADKNQKEGEAFLAQNKTKEGVVTMPSGLQYRVLKAGDGKKPADGDTVECHYRGTLVDGTEFDNSYRVNKSAAFELKNGVIPGWSEALKLMPVGSKWQLFIPPQLAYGERGAGPYIGPNATLIFEVELLGIK